MLDNGKGGLHRLTPVCSVLSQTHRVTAAAGCYHTPKTRLLLLHFVLSLGQVADELAGGSVTWEVKLNRIEQQGRRLVKQLHLTLVQLSHHDL